MGRLMFTVLKPVSTRADQCVRDNGSEKLGNGRGSVLNRPTASDKAAVAMDGKVI